MRILPSLSSCSFESVHNYIKKNKLTTTVALLAVALFATAVYRATRPSLKRKNSPPPSNNNQATHANKGQVVTQETRASQGITQVPQETPASQVVTQVPQETRASQGLTQVPQETQASQGITQVPQETQANNLATQETPASQGITQVPQETQANNLATPAIQVSETQNSSEVDKADKATVSEPEEVLDPKVVEFNTRVKALSEATQGLQALVKAKKFIGYCEEVADQGYARKPPESANIDELDRQLQALHAGMDALDACARANTDLIEYSETRTLIKRGQKLANACAHIIFVFKSTCNPSSTIYAHFSAPYQVHWMLAKGATERNAVKRQPLDTWVFERRAEKEEMMSKSEKTQAFKLKFNTSVENLTMTTQSIKALVQEKNFVIYCKKIAGGDWRSLTIFQNNNPDINKLNRQCEALCAYIEALQILIRRVAIKKLLVKDSEISTVRASTLVEKGQKLANACAQIIYILNSEYGVFYAPYYLYWNSAIRTRGAVEKHPIDISVFEKEEEQKEAVSEPATVLAPKVVEFDTRVSKVDEVDEADKATRRVVVEFNTSVKTLTEATQGIKALFQAKNFVKYCTDAKGGGYGWSFSYAENLPEKNADIDELDRQLQALRVPIDALDGLNGLNKQILSIVEISYSEIITAGTLVTNGKKLANACAHIIFVFQSICNPFFSKYNHFSAPYLPWRKDVNGAITERWAVQKQPIDTSVFEREAEKKEAVPEPEEVDPKAVVEFDTRVSEADEADEATIAEAEKVEFESSVSALTEATQGLKRLVRLAKFIEYCKEVAQTNYSGKITESEIDELSRQLQALCRCIDDVDAFTNTSIKRVEPSEISAGRTLVENGQKLANTCAHIVFVYKSLELFARNSSYIPQEIKIFSAPYSEPWKAAKGATERVAVMRQPLDTSVFEEEEEKKAAVSEPATVLDPKGVVKFKVKRRKRTQGKRRKEHQHQTGVN